MGAENRDKQDKRQNFSVTEVTTPEQYVAFFKWRKSIQTGSFDEEPANNISHAEAVRDLADQRTRIFIVIVDNVIVAGAMIDVEEADKDGKQYGDLNSAHVAPGFRRRGFLGGLTAARLEWARQQGLEFVQANIATDNVPSLRSKLKDGFCVISENGRGGLEVKKNLLPEAEKDIAEEKYVPLDQLYDSGVSEDMNTNGWRGIGLKPIGSEDDMSPSNWALQVVRYKKRSS